MRLILPILAIALTLAPAHTEEIPIPAPDLTVPATPIPLTAIPTGAASQMRGSQLAATIAPHLARLYPGNAATARGRAIRRALEREGDTPANVAALRAWLASLPSHP